jgi:error-prone DNA polymerase
MVSGYAALFCKSNFSFLEGASHPDELVNEANRLGLTALALCDRDGFYGIVRAWAAAKEVGMQIISGAEMTVDDGSTIVLLAETKAGYSNLCQLITKGRLRAEKGSCVVTWDEVCERAPGVVALWGGERSALARGQELEPLIHQVKDAYQDRLYALLTRHLRPEETQQEQRLSRRAAQHRIPLVASNEVLYHSPARRPLQDVLACIRAGETIHHAGQLLKPNAEHAFKTPHAFHELYRDAPGAIARTLEIAERCKFSLSELRYRYPSEQLPDGTTSAQWLRLQTMEGAAGRYHGDIPLHIREQLEKELQVIEQLDYCGYFLTMKDIVEFCRAKNILCQGRGSAANSVVCFCLGITAADPARVNLLFERFLSLERHEPPDIDLDIEHQRREEVIQHVYAKYGRARAAMVANVISYRSRSAIRDVGKALGIPTTELEQMGRMLSHHHAADGGTLAQAGIVAPSPIYEQLLTLSNELLGFPRHLSIHPGGFLLGHEEVSTLVPIENATMEDRTVIQWDKDDVEALGLFKVDLLGLGALSHLHRCFDLILKHHGRQLSIATIPDGDIPTYEAITRADTVGVFQIESRAQMSMLPRLKPKTYYDIVIQISIVRPGPITGGMVHPYLRRREGLEEIEYPHELLRPVLEKTLGIPLFQEQVMKLAVVAADYTPGEADQLRRDMAAWRKTGRIEAHKERLISRMEKKGIKPEFAERVFKQICGFGEYGFPESHAASFALISYAGAYLKRHYPAEFACSLINSLPMGFYSTSSIVEDARRHRVEIRPIDARVSGWDCALEPSEKSQGGLAIRMGLNCIKGLSEIEASKIVEAAAAVPLENDSLTDFVRRARLNEKQLASLAEVGALDSFGLARREALWEVRGLSRAEPTPLAVDRESALTFRPLTPFESIGWDYKRASHSAEGHILKPLRAALRAQRLPDSSEVAKMRNGQRVRYAGLVICRQHPGTAAGVTFMTLEDEKGFVNAVLWKQVFEDNEVIARTASLLGITGKLQIESGVVHVIVEQLWAPQLRELPQPLPSRDFH